MIFFQWVGLGGEYNSGAEAAPLKRSYFSLDTLNWGAFRTKFHLLPRLFSSFFLGEAMKDNIMVGEEIP